MTKFRSLMMSYELNDTTAIDECFPKRRAICSIPEEDEVDEDDDDFTDLTAKIESRSSPPSVMAELVSATEMRASLEGALMAILPREERIKRAAATSQVEWSHVRKSFAPGPRGLLVLGWRDGGTVIIDFQGFIRCATCYYHLVVD